MNRANRAAGTKALVGDWGYLIAVVFDDGVGEQGVTHIAHFVGCGGLAVFVDAYLYVFADAHAVDGVEPQLTQGGLYGLSLRIADGGSYADIDFGEVWHIAGRRDYGLTAALAWM